MKHSAFTLVELMVVIAIIAVIAGVALPSYQDYRVRAQTSSAFDLLNQFANEILEEYSKTGSLPAYANTMLLTP